MNMVQDNYKQKHCAHCYQVLPAQRQRRSDIICASCESAWLKSAEHIFQRYVARPDEKLEKNAPTP
jgi:hypothetical protein